jgi:DNA-binding NtrC family response regulator
VKGTILVVDDERSIRIAIQQVLEEAGHRVTTAGSAEEAMTAVGKDTFDVVVTDLTLEGRSGMELLDWLREHAPDAAVVMITAHGSERTAVEAMKRGAVDYLPKPFDNDELQLVVERALEGVILRRDVRRLREQVAGPYRFENLLGRSPAMRRVFDVLRKVADTNLTVLVQGPSGSGKELVANALHFNSRRRTKPFVKVNCAAFSRELVESELFGHERGAFTGAAGARAGKFEAADGGTLLLDEIGDMSLETQAKILRVLQEGEIQRVGSDRTLRVDVRVVAATNHDLEAKVQERTFREDLYYRLNVVSVRLPSLRNRTEDLPLLIEHFLAAAARRLGGPPRRLGPEAYRALLAHDWPGNVRELEHALERGTALAGGDVITLDDLPDAVRGRGAASASPDWDALPPSFKEAKQLTIDRFERGFVTAALARHHGNVSKAAEEMGMYRQHLQVKLQELGIDATSFRRE